MSLTQFARASSSPLRVSGSGPVVMVDDNPIDAEVLGFFFERSRLVRELIHVDSGRALLALLDARSGLGLEPPALVLMDINMPGMTGHEALAAVREDPAYQALPVILMLTSSKRRDDVEQARQLGADGYVTKPMNGADYQAFFNGLVPAQYYLGRRKAS